MPIGQEIGEHTRFLIFISAIVPTCEERSRVSGWMIQRFSRKKRTRRCHGLAGILLFRNNMPGVYLESTRLDSVEKKVSGRAQVSPYGARIFINI
jgi:hypothetical protein